MKTRHPLFQQEDYWAIWLGGFILVLGLFLFFYYGKQSLKQEMAEVNQQLDEARMKAPFETVQWHELQLEKRKLTGSRTNIGRAIKYLLSKPITWTANPLESFIITRKKVEAQRSKWHERVESKKVAVAKLKSEAGTAEAAARATGFKDDALNAAAIRSMKSWLKAESEYRDLLSKVNQKPLNMLPSLLLLGLVFSILFGAGGYVMGMDFKRFVIGFGGVFVFAVVAFLFAAQSDMKQMGFGYALWAIVIGLVISNTVGTPDWMKPALQTEYYIKTGLVLLGAEILFGKILTIGLPGIFVAWVVTPIVLISTFWFGQKILKISSKTLNITISADMSVCGVSAAIATAAACKAKKEELTLAVGLSMVFTSIMMIALPLFIRLVKMPEILGGAWIGGTIDATGAVVAAGAFLGDDAMNVAATIKMIQNILIGVIAFGVAFYWAVKIEKTGNSQVGIREIWTRFPKFVLGFIGASVLFSVLDMAVARDWADALIDHGVLRGMTKDIRAWLFCLAFVSIGFSTNFKELKAYFKGGKPLVLYVTGQLLNLILTLLMAYLMFYVVFPEILELI